MSNLTSKKLLSNTIKLIEYENQSWVQKSFLLGDEAILRFFYLTRRMVLEIRNSKDFWKTTRQLKNRCSKHQRNMT